jgi:hypothetical protein
MINFSLKKFFQFQIEVRVLGRNLGHEGFGALKADKCKKTKKQSAIKLSFKKFFQFKSEARVSGRNLGYEGFVDLEWIK